MQHISIVWLRCITDICYYFDDFQLFIDSSESLAYNRKIILRLLNDTYLQIIL